MMVVKDPQVSVKELTLFFAVTLIASFAYVILSGYVESGVGSEAATTWYREKALVIIWAPLTFALLMSMLFRGKAGLALIASRFDPRGISLRWWLTALLLPIVVHVIPVYLSGGFAERTASEFSLVWMDAFALLFVVMIGEELGWRGYALPALQARFTPFVASLILGGLWASWHYPVWFGLGYGPAGDVGIAIAFILINSVGIIAMALIFTWLVNNTNACILLAMLYHGSNNATLRLYGSADATTPFLVSTGVVILVAAAIVLSNRETFFLGPEKEAAPSVRIS